MKTIEIKGWIFMRVSRYGDQPTFTFFSFDASEGDPTYIKLCEHKIVTEVPENFNPRAEKIAALEKEKTKVRAEMGRRITEIENEIGKWKAIEYTPAQESA